MTLSSWLTTWMSDYMTGTARESTLNSYQSIIDSYIVPYLGNKPLYMITATDVQKLYYTLKFEGRINEHPEFGYELSDAAVS